MITVQTACRVVVDTVSDDDAVWKLEHRRGYDRRLAVEESAGDCGVV